MKPVTAIATVLLALVALLHLLRLIFGVEAVVGGRLIPMWPSGLATLIAGGVALQLWRESRPKRSGGPA
jgi:hypothetical protein